MSNHFYDYEILSEIFEKSFNSIMVLRIVGSDNGEISDFVIDKVNNTCLKALNRKKEELERMQVTEVYPYARSNGLFDLLLRAVKDGSAEEDLYYYDPEYKGWVRNSAFCSGEHVVIYFRDVTFQKQLEENLKQSLKEKELLLKEVHHRVKNNLQIIASILNIQASFIEDPILYNLIMDNQNRIKTVALIHQKLYESNQSLLSINLEYYFKDLVESIFNTMKKENIKLVCHIEDFTININTAIYLGLIINELLTNAIKYAFPENKKGKIEVIIHDGEKTGTAIVRDNGVGIAEEIFHRPPETVGMELVHALIKQIDAKITLNTHKGTEFIIIFPRCES